MITMISTTRSKVTHCKAAKYRKKFQVLENTVNCWLIYMKASSYD
jgi:hypothetical protein